MVARLTTLLMLVAAGACLLSPRHPGDYSQLDAGVLAVAIDDFKATDECAPVADHPIRIDAMTLTSDVMASDAQVRGDTNSEDWSSVATMLEDLRQRNSESQPLFWRPPDSLGAVVTDLSTLESEYDFVESFPKTRCHLRLWLPGYSRDGDQALLRFLWGPTSHGASATYFLERSDGSWRIRWKHIAIYVDLLPNMRVQLASRR